MACRRGDYVKLNFSSFKLIMWIRKKFKQAQKEKNQVKNCFKLLEPTVISDALAFRLQAIKLSFNFICNISRTRGCEEKKRSELKTKEQKETDT